MTYANIEDALTAIARGELVVLIDDADVDEQGHLVFAAETAAPEKVGFMIRHASGVVCTTLTPERAYALQDDGVDTVQANLELGFPVDARRYDAAAHILRDLGPRSVRLISNNPEKFAALERYGVAITRRVRIRSRPNPHNHGYLLTKQRKLGHDLELPLSTPCVTPARKATTPHRQPRAALRTKPV